MGSMKETFYVSTVKENGEHENNMKVKNFFDLNKLPEDLCEVAEEIVEDSMDKSEEYADMDEVQSIFRVRQKCWYEYLCEFAEEIVEDSMDKGEEYADMEEVQSIFRVRDKCWYEDFLTGLHFDDKNQLDLNKYPKEGYDFGFETEALNNEVFTMLKIYMNRFY
jgi:hypothetical protein